MNGKPQRGTERKARVSKNLVTVKREWRWCAYWEKGTHHAGLSQAHGQAEPGRHGWWQQVTEARAHVRTDHSKASDHSLYYQLSGESSQSLHFWRNCPKEESSRLEKELGGKNSLLEKEALVPRGREESRFQQTLGVSDDDFYLVQSQGLWRRWVPVLDCKFPGSQSAGVLHPLHIRIPEY